MTAPGLYLLDGVSSLPVLVDAEGVPRWATRDALAGVPVSAPVAFRLAPVRLEAVRLDCCEAGVCRNPAPVPTPESRAAAALDARSPS